MSMRPVMQKGKRIIIKKLRTADAAAAVKIPLIAVTLAF
jgi:hypothetical protein